MKPLWTEMYVNDNWIKMGTTPNNYKVTCDDVAQPEWHVNRREYSALFLIHIKHFHFNVN